MPRTTHPHFATLEEFKREGRFMAEIGEPERKVRREREDQPGVTPAQPITVPEAVPVS